MKRILALALDMHTGGRGHRETGERDRSRRTDGRTDGRTDWFIRTNIQKGWNEGRKEAGGETSFASYDAY